ncbi:MAG TPA: tRNA epoxyqueuosine(34) reductase QueG [Candidatus Marinimicrobia bacterium]|nr:tRNA epoxyqueuosine(34) reductase QueG [Candidatus Neomarinimicrobiota bacterium]HRS51921.1 tRNA epoxyqueuosine(34) reductase QueG [Candidatus Neomarinimicrobiota bacterium]HRU93454.1 tRNA epoxyqueuosine(34) reductase QueG [Candidatus Neomarinimicrobiota bacterium]
MSLTTEIMRLAKSSGFARAGISPPFLEDKYVTAFQRWIDAGFLGSMSWMRKYYDFQDYLKTNFGWAKSVLVVADNYFQNVEWLTGIPKIARYAWGQDYHRVVEQKLARVCREINFLEPAAVTCIFVDSGPVMQKIFAWQAGLGWIGKNNLLIVPELGSYCFIGMVFLNLEISFNEPLSNSCGDCQLCLDACPNKALVDEHLLDARLCTAYLTIEKDGEFSEIEKKNLRGWVYGCDTCQKICPYNQRWNRPGDVRYSEYYSKFSKSLSEWLKVTEDEFGEIFQDSPIRRIGFTNWRRNLLAHCE